MRHRVVHSAIVLGCVAAVPLLASAPPPPGHQAPESNPLALLPALPKVHHSSAIEPINATDPVMLHCNDAETISTTPVIHWLFLQLVPDV